MTSRPAPPATTTPAGVVHRDGPSRAVSVVVRRRVVNTVVGQAVRDRGGTTGVPRVPGPEGVTGQATEEVAAETTEEVAAETTGAVRIAVLEAGQSAMTSGGAQCSCRRSRDCRSPRSPTMSPASSWTDQS